MSKYWGEKMAITTWAEPKVRTLNYLCCPNQQSKTQRDFETSSTCHVLIGIQFLTDNNNIKQTRATEKQNHANGFYFMDVFKREIE